MTNRHDSCDLCVKHDARWVCLDDKKHVYWELFLARRLRLDLRRRDQQDSYYVCQQCREQIERYNATSKWPRRLRFLPWS
jgi:hypothetical protein